MRAHRPISVPVASSSSKVAPCQARNPSRASTACNEQRMYHPICPEGLAHPCDPSASMSFACDARFPPAVGSHWSRRMSAPFQPRLRIGDCAHSREDLQPPRGRRVHDLHVSQNSCRQATIRTILECGRDRPRLHHVCIERRLSRRRWHARFASWVRGSQKTFRKCGGCTRGVVAHDATCASGRLARHSVPPTPYRTEVDVRIKPVPHLRDDCIRLRREARHAFPHTMFHANTAPRSDTLVYVLGRRVEL